MLVESGIGSEDEAEYLSRDLIKDVVENLLGVKNDFNIAVRKVE